MPAHSPSRDATVDDAIRLLAGRAVSGAPVVDGSGRVVGVVIESDLLRIPLRPDPRGLGDMPQSTTPRLVAAVMTPSPFTTHERADVAHLATVFGERRWKSIPVVRDGRLVGMVSRSDVMRVLSRRDNQIGRQVSRHLEVYGYRRWRAHVEDARVWIYGPRETRDARLAEAIAASVPGVRQVTVEMSGTPPHRKGDEASDPAGVPDKQLQRWADDGGALP